MLVVASQAFVHLWTLHLFNISHDWTADPTVSFYHIYLTMFLTLGCLFSAPLYRHQFFNEIHNSELTFAYSPLTQLIIIWIQSTVIFQFVFIISGVEKLFYSPLSHTAAVLCIRDYSLSLTEQLNVQNTKITQCYNWAVFQLRLQMLLQTSVDHLPSFFHPQ